MGKQTKSTIQAGTNGDAYIMAIESIVGQIQAAGEQVEWPFGIQTRGGRVSSGPPGKTRTVYLIETTDGSLFYANIQGTVFRITGGKRGAPMPTWDSVSADAWTVLDPRFVGRSAVLVNGQLPLGLEWSPSENPSESPDGVIHTKGKGADHGAAKTGGGWLKPVAVALAAYLAYRELS